MELAYASTGPRPWRRLGAGFERFSITTTRIPTLSQVGEAQGISAASMRPGESTPMLP